MVATNGLLNFAALDFFPGYAGAGWTRLCGGLPSGPGQQIGKVRVRHRAMRSVPGGLVHDRAQFVQIAGPGMGR